MVSVLDYSRRGSLLHFVYGTAGLDDGAWEYTAQAEPIEAMFRDALLLFALERGASLSAEEVARRVEDEAASRPTPRPPTDWLGLALFAAQRVREVMGRLAEGGPTSQQEYFATARLASLLEAICERTPQAGLMGRTGPAPGAGGQAGEADSARRLSTAQD
jgi:hypothetical protein